MTLEELMKLCRENNVMEVSGVDVEEVFQEEGRTLRRACTPVLRFHPEVRPLRDLETVKPVDNPTPEVRTSKLGKDRLTAEQQLEQYGRVIDAG